MNAERLSERLPRATRDLHTQAERAGVMRRLLAGHVGRGEYVRLLASLHAIYAALERALGDARVRALAPLPNLGRTAALACDLRDYGAPPGATTPAPLAADYATHVAGLVAHDPLRVAAHAYVRYLGDLSGGQMVRGIVVQAGHLPAGRGVAFYDLGDAATVARTKTDIRTVLDTLPASRHDDVIAEARVAFERHVALFAAIPAGED
ncbi:MAG: biliverdin-producing heme oxygenase [Burkholderiales bacterium]